MTFRLLSKLSRDELVSVIEDAPLLSKCGGPYPQDLLLAPLPSWGDAVDCIEDMVLDPIPVHRLDKLMIELQRMATASRVRSLKPIQRILRLLRGDKSRLVVSRQEEACIRSAVDRALNIPIVGERDRGIVGLHLEELLRVMFAMPIVRPNPDGIWVQTAGVVMLDGFLPVDVADVSGVERLLVF
jgi:hypothetical protein